MSTPVQSPFLNIHEAAVYLRMSEANVYRMVRKRAIPGFRLGARWRFRIADLEQFATDMVASRPISTNEVGYEQRGAV